MELIFAAQQELGAFCVTLTVCLSLCVLCACPFAALILSVYQHSRGSKGMFCITIKLNQYVIYNLWYDVFKIQLCKIIDVMKLHKFLYPYLYQYYAVLGSFGKVSTDSLHLDCSSLAYWQILSCFITLNGKYLWTNKVNTIKTTWIRMHMLTNVRQYQLFWHKSPGWCWCWQR